MSALAHTRFVIPRACLVLAAACLVHPLAAQPAAEAATKPKVKLVPRPLPGMGSSSSNSRDAAQSPKTGPDLAAAEAEARAKVPLFRPASVNSSATAQVETLPVGAMRSTPQVQSGSDRARIIVIRRRGTFQMPKEPAREAPVIVNDLSDRNVSPEVVPVALPPGKIRVIPRDSVNLRTSLPPSQP